MIIGILCIIYAISNLSLIGSRFHLYYYYRNNPYYDYGTDYVIYPIVSLLISIPSIVSGIMFGMWFLKDVPENRHRLPLACLLQLITCAG